MKLAPFGCVVLIEDEVAVGVVEVVVTALLGPVQNLRSVVPGLAALELEQLAGQPHHPLAAHRLPDAEPLVDDPGPGIVIVPARRAIVMRAELVDPAVEIEEVVAAVLGWQGEFLPSHLAPVVAKEELQRPAVHAEMGVEEPHEPGPEQHPAVPVPRFEHGPQVLSEVWSEVHLRSDLHAHPPIRTVDRPSAPAPPPSRRWWPAGSRQRSSRCWRARPASGLCARVASIRS